MNPELFGTFGRSFGLVQASCEVVEQAFRTWQDEFLSKWGMSLRSEICSGTIVGALRGLLPRTSPIATKYLFWPVGQGWTLFFDNGVSGTDAGAPSVLSARVHSNAIRVVMSQEIVDAVTKKISQYGATIFEYHADGIERRHVFAANDGGKWKFGQAGNPFEFEDVAAYNERSIQKRFTPAMLLAYLKALGVELDGNIGSEASHSGYILTKIGKMPASLREYFE